MPALAVRASLPPISADPRQGTITMSIAGATLTLLSDGAVWWEAERTLIVSDLHLEKGSRMAMRGQFVPPYDTGLTSFARGTARRRPSARSRDLARRCLRRRRRRGSSRRTRARPDHTLCRRDATGSGSPVTMIRSLRLRSAAFKQMKLRLARWCSGIRRVPAHPKARSPAIFIRRRACFLGPKSVRRRCFAGDGTRLILPAIGAYTGGLSVLSDAFAGLFKRDTMTVGLLGDGRVYAFPRRMLSI